MANTTQPTPPQPTPPPPPKPEDEEEEKKKRAAKAKELFDKDEKEAKDNPGSWTSQVDQLRRSAEMEQVGVEAWMVEQERRIRERQGDPPIEPRQVHGVAVAVKSH